MNDRRSELTAATLPFAGLLSDVTLLRRMRAEADRMLAARGAAHLVAVPADGQPAPARPWSIDPIPVVIDGATFDGLAAAVVERMRGLERLVADLYGARTVVQSGVVPAEQLVRSTAYRLSHVGTTGPPRWLATYAVDVTRLRDGTWRVVQDRTDAPSGLGFALLDRSVMVRVVSDVFGRSPFGPVASITGFGSELRRALATVTNAPGPRIVVFTQGPRHPAYVEHSYLARHLGFHLVEAEDLVVRRQRLWLRTIGELEPIDVAYRRVDDAACDPVELFSNDRGGVPGLLGAVADGGVMMANGHGTGVLEDPALVPYWPKAIAALVGETPRLAPFDDAARAIGIDAMPSFLDGELTEAPVVIRLHGVAGPSGIRVMAGGNGRVLGIGDDPDQPTALAAKDVWVLGAQRSSPVVLGPAMAQVDLSRSVPTRAADAFFEAGRAVERAGVVARTIATVGVRREQDPALDVDTGGQWGPRMVELLRTVCDEPLLVATEEALAGMEAGDHGGVGAAMQGASRVLAEQLRTLVASATSIGEYLPGTAARVLARLAGLRAQLAARTVGFDMADDIAADLAAFDGLWAESTVRGDAWRFGDLGRRLERARAVAGLVDACRPRSETALTQAVNIEVMLAVNESLNAYRRRYRTDIEPCLAIGFVVDHDDNPRSLVSAIGRARHHAATLGWPDGVATAEQILAALPAVSRDPDLITGVRDDVVRFLELVDRTWFATPVNPIRMRPVRGSRG